MSLQQVQMNEAINEQQNTEEELQAVHYRTMSPEEIDGLKERVESVKKEFESYRYRLDIDQDMMNRYFDFIKNEAKFDGKDCLGLPKVHEALEDCVKEGNKVVMGGRPQYTLSNMHLEALYYYLTKVTGAGLQEATRLKELLDPILDSLSRAVVRRNTLQSFLEKAEAKLHGIIDPDENIDPTYEENVQGE
jgi:hypothetical protein